MTGKFELIDITEIISAPFYFTLTTMSISILGTQIVTEIEQLIL